MGNRGRGILQEKLGTGEGGGGGLFYMKVKKEVEGVLIVDSQVKVGKEKGNFFVKLLRIPEFAKVQVLHLLFASS